MKERKELREFIKQVGLKNYSEANKYLQRVIDSKVKNRIKQSFNKPLF
jgi:hypothetical protein